MIVALVVCVVFGLEVLFRNRYNKNEFTINIGVIMIVTVITMFMAMFTSYDISIMWAITEATKLKIFKDRKIRINNIHAFEKIAKVDCMVIEKQGALTNRNDIKVDKLYVCDKIEKSSLDDSNQF